MVGVRLGEGSAWSNGRGFHLGGVSAWKKCPLKRGVRIAEGSAHGRCPHWRGFCLVKWKRFPLGRSVRLGEGSACGRCPLKGAVLLWRLDPIFFLSQ